MSLKNGQDLGNTHRISLNVRFYLDDMINSSNKKALADN